MTSSVVVLTFIIGFASCLTREELVDHLKHKQEVRTTFDSRVPQLVRPLGYIAGEPIWPRVLERAESINDIFFDDDNFAYSMPRRDAAALVRRMDKEENYNKIIKFLEKYT
ncbi:unnamed protein product [Auanema sp. JU1783]|nr:unnamed protein product [Auanema sp. JU1783]